MKSAMAIEVELARRLWSVDEYQRMVDAGILSKRDRVELVHGEIVHMTPIGHLHAAAVAALVALLNRRLEDRVVVWPQGSLPLPPRSMPEPDVLVLRPRTDFYRNAAPRPGDVLLVVEVADTSLRYDRLVKMPLYAAAGVPEAWVVDVDGRRIETHRTPRAGEYAELNAFAREAVVIPTAFPDLAIPVVQIVG
jgi:Uma2 family endonuclease